MVRRSEEESTDIRHATFGTGEATEEWSQTWGRGCFIPQVRGGTPQPNAPSGTMMALGLPSSRM